MSRAEVRRVLMTADTVGGVWTFALELIASLQAHGVEVILATLGGEPSQNQRRDAAAIPNLCIETSGYKLEWMDDPRADVERSGNWLLALERDYAPDVIHLNSFGHGALPWRSPAAITAHSDVLSWWKAVRQTPIPREWDKYRETVARSLQYASMITAPSQAMLSSLVINYGVDLRFCRMVPNGRHAARFRAAGKEPFVLAAGRLWDEAKNIQALADIAGSLPWPIYLAGDATSPDGLPATLDGCYPLGQLCAETLADWYSRAAIYAAPAVYEPFGLSILEAALSECALVLGDIDSLREIWEGAALFLPGRDRERLTSTLNDLIVNPVLRQELAARSATRARELSAARMTDSYVQIYRELVEQRRLACAS